MEETLIKTGAAYNIVLIVFHLMFWKLFDWPGGLKTSSFINRNTIQVLNISLTLVFLIFAYISLIHTTELINTALGNSLLVLMSLFWFARAIQQVVFYRLKHWLSWAFMLYFLLGSLLYAIPVVLIRT